MPATWPQALPVQRRYDSGWDIPNMSLVHIDDLVRWLGYNQNQVKRATRWLIENNIPYFSGKDGVPCTTLEAINSKLVSARPANDDSGNINF